MDQIEANCPHCGTSFTVSTDQLKVANGHVRCGVCMKVFKAAEIEEEPQAPAPPADNQAASKPAISLDDDASIEAWIKKNQKTGNKNIQSGPVDAPENIEKESLSFDDELSDAFSDLGMEDTEEKKEEPGLELELEKDEDEGESEDDSIQLDDIETAVPAYKAAMDEDETLDDDFVDSISHGKNPLETHQIGEGIDEDDLMVSDDFSGAFGEDIDDDPFGSGGDQDILQVALGSTEIEDEEIIETSQMEKILWPSVAAVFSLILLIQLAIVNFRDLSTDPDYRGVYGVFCGIGICDLPALSDVNSIRGSNLIVRPHPRQKNALIVDAIINNQAPFDQSFPELYLSFSDVQGKVIASRKFKPSEYLQGELKGMSSMPSQTPLHLSLEIIDPGKQASSYRLDFVKGS